MRKIQKDPIDTNAVAIAMIAALLITPTVASAQIVDFLKKKAAEVIQIKPDSAPAPAEAASTAAAPAASSDSAGAPPLQAYQGYDFVPGETIVFEDNFESDEDGEFPEHWNQLDGQGAVNTVAGRRVFARMAGESGYPMVSPAIKKAQYLADAWTLEFDSYAGEKSTPPILYFFNADTDKHDYWGNVSRILLGDQFWGGVRVVIAKPAELDVQQVYPDSLKGPNFLNHWHHIAVAYKEGRLKIYIDQFRIYSLQDMKVHPRAVAFDSGGTQAKPNLIANVRIANGAGIKLVDKKFTDTKIVTHGINFDTDKATIKAESMGTLNMIVDILKNNPDLRFEIQGHTDNSGAAAHNLDLSRQRAEAVKTQLVAMGVDTARLTTKGLGDTKPIADNASFEGRANNRRVEFIKL